MKYLLFLIIACLLIGFYDQTAKHGALLSSGRIPDILKAKRRAILFLVLAVVMLLLFSLSGCKKDYADWQNPIAVGTKFRYEYKQYGDVPWKGPAPKQPFTVDSIKVNAYPPYDGYWVSNSEGRHFILPPVDIRAYIIK